MRVPSFSEAVGVSHWRFSPRLWCSLPLATCHISAATVWERAPEFKRRPPEFLCRVIDSTVSAVRILLPVRAAVKQRASGALPQPLRKHFNDYNNHNNNNCHLINMALITATAAGRIPRVWKTTQRATAQIKSICDGLIDGCGCFASPSGRKRRRGERSLLTAACD